MFSRLDNTLISKNDSLTQLCKKIIIKKRETIKWFINFKLSFYKFKFLKDDFFSNLF